MVIMDVTKSVRTQHIKDYNLECFFVVDDEGKEDEDICCVYSLLFGKFPLYNITCDQWSIHYVFSRQTSTKEFFFDILTCV